MQSDKRIPTCDDPAKFLRELREAYQALKSERRTDVKEVLLDAAAGRN